MNLFGIGKPLGASGLHPHPITKGGSNRLAPLKLCSELYLGPYSEMGLASNSCAHAFGAPAKNKKDRARIFAKLSCTLISSKIL